MSRMKKFFQFRIMLVILFVLTGTAEAIAQQDTLSFLHITDTHLIFNLNLYQHNLAQSRRHYGNGVIPLKEFFGTVPEKNHCGFVTVTGDLVDFYEAQTPDGSMMGCQIEPFIRLLNASPVPVLLTLGNHDIANYSWGDSVMISSQLCAEQARAAWIRNAPCFREGTYYSRVFKTGGTTYRLIFLDDGYDIVNAGEQIMLPYIDRAQCNWLKNQLQQSFGDVDIILMHYPLTGNIQSVTNNEFYAVLSRSSALKLILDGHNHRNSIREFSFPGCHFYQVQTGAFGQSANNWRIIKLTGNAVIVSFPGKTENELTIPIK